MRVFLCSMLLSLCGCAALGLAPSTSSQDTIAYAYSGVTAALSTLDTAILAGQISSQDAVKINADIMVVKAGLDAAQSVATSSAPVAVSVITAATAALVPIGAYLTCKQTGGTSCPLP
jgi:hypothetical protein